MKGTADSITSALENMKGPGLEKVTKEIDTFSSIAKNIAKQAKAKVSWTPWSSQVGRQFSSVSEDGRPEFFHGGGGENILFSPGGAGKIFNASETMGLFRAGLEGVAGAAAPAMNMARGGSGNQTVLNLTINADATKEIIMRIREDEIVNNLET